MTGKKTDKDGVSLKPGQVRVGSEDAVMYKPGHAPRDEIRCQVRQNAEQIEVAVHQLGKGGGLLGVAYPQVPFQTSDNFAFYTAPVLRPGAADGSRVLVGNVDIRLAAGELTGRCAFVGNRETSLDAHQGAVVPAEKGKQFPDIDNRKAFPRPPSVEM